jgi:hypothetical protein
VAGSFSRTSTSTTRDSGGCSGWCTRGAAAGEDGALLAQPLRDAYSKLSGIVPGVQATKMLRWSKANCQDPRSARAVSTDGLGSFRDLLVEVARDPAMLVWLDGRVNTRARPAGELRA